MGRAVDITEARVRGIIDAFPDPLCVIDREGVVIDANSRMEALLGGKGDGDRRRCIDNFLPHELAYEIKHHVSKASEDGEESQAQFEWPSDGRAVLVVPIKDSGTSAGTWMVVVRPGAPAGNLKRDLETEDDLMHVLMNHLPDYVFLKDDQSRFILSNASHLRVMGARSLEEVVGKTDFDFFPSEFAEKYYADERQILQSGQPLISREERVIDSTGCEHALLTTKLPLRDQHGKIAGIFGVSRDVTLLKEAEMQLRRTREELELRVQERTAELARANEELRAEISKREEIEAELRSSELKFRTLFEESKDSVFISSPEGKFLDINPAGVELYQYGSKDELLNIDVANDLYVNPRDRQEFQKELEEKGYVKDMEMLLKKKTGEEVVVLETAIAVHDARGNIVAYQGITHDITSRKRAEEALRKAHAELEQRVMARTAELADANSALQIEIAERRQAEEAMRDSEEKYRTLFEESRDAIYIASRDGTLLEMNHYALDLFGYEKQEIQGKNAEVLYVDPSDRLRFQQEIERRGFVRDFEVRLKKKDGTQLDCLLTSTIRWAKDESILGYQGSIRDITERKRAEAELRKSRQILREFSARLQAVREEEKRRIAREIHDELGQALTSLKIDLAWSRKMLASKRSSKAGAGLLAADRKLILAKLKSMVALTDKTIRIVQTTSTELRPVVLDEFGLLAAIEWQLGEFQSRTGIKCELSTSLPEISLDEQRHSTAVFRIFQETLTNIARHAQATKAKVSLHQHGTDLLLTVEDNGRGITDAEITSSKSLGLLGMRERAILFGGDIMIEGAPGKGTAVSVRIPLRRTST